MLLTYYWPHFIPVTGHTQQCPNRQTRRKDVEADAEAPPPPPETSHPRLPFYSADLPGELLFLPGIPTNLNRQSPKSIRASLEAASLLTFLFEADAVLDTKMVLVMTLVGESSATRRNVPQPAHSYSLFLPPTSSLLL